VWAGNDVPKEKFSYNSSRDVVWMSHVKNTGNAYILHNERETKNLKWLRFSSIFSQFVFPIKLIAHRSFLCYSYNFSMFLLQSKGKIQLFLQEYDYICLFL
jgi:hypothetical protein